MFVLCMEFLGWHQCTTGALCAAKVSLTQSFYSAPNSMQELPNTLASLFYFFSLIFYFHPCNRLSQKGGPSYSLHFTMVMINIALEKVHKFFPEKIPSCLGFSKHLEVENWHKIIRELRRQVKKKKSQRIVQTSGPISPHSLTQASPTCQTCCHNLKQPTVQIR